MWKNFFCAGDFVLRILSLSGRLADQGNSLLDSARIFSESYVEDDSIR